MCDPVSIGSAALTGIGTLMNMQAQGDYVKRQNAANEDAAAFSRSKRTAENARQDEMARQSRAAVSGEEDRNTLEAQQASLDQERARRETSYAANVPAAADPNRVALLPSQGTDQVVKGQAEKDLADFLGRARGQIAARARLEAFGGLQNRNDLATALANSSITQNAGLRRASMALADQETNIPAARVGAPDTTLGTVLSTLGGIGMYAGGKGFNPFGGGGGPSKGAEFTARSTGLSNAPGGFGFGSPF
jgi:hypothetical protein